MKKMKSDTALIIIDMINKMDFEGAELLLENTRPIVKPILNLKKEAKKKGHPVIFVNDNFELWHEDVKNLIEECKKGIAKEIVEQFTPEKDEFFIIKPKHSGFHGTQLDILLRQLGVKKLILTGVAGDICVLSTANDAYMREYDLWVPKDCIASEHKRDNASAIQLINRSMFANVKPTNEVTIDE